MNGQNALSTVSKEDLQPSLLSQTVREMGITTVRKSVEDDTLPSVGNIVAAIGYRETAAAVVLQIERLGMMLNVSKPMQPEAVAETAKMVVDACREAGIKVTFADIDIVFRRARSGEYGRFYGGFGSADVMGWFNAYFAEKTEEYVKINQERSRQYDMFGERSSERAKAEDMRQHKAAAEYYRDKLKRN